MSDDKNTEADKFVDTEEQLRKVMPIGTVPEHKDSPIISFFKKRLRIIGKDSLNQGNLESQH